MTVSQVIETLQQFPSDKDVVVGNWLDSTAEFSILEFVEHVEIMFSANSFAKVEELNEREEK